MATTIACVDTVATISAATKRAARTADRAEKPPSTLALADGQSYHRRVRMNSAIAISVSLACDGRRTDRRPMACSTNSRAAPNA